MDMNQADAAWNTPPPTGPSAPGAGPVGNAPGTAGTGADQRGRAGYDATEDTAPDQPYDEQAKSGATEDKSKPAGARQFPCKNCGGPLLFIPGTSEIRCPYCGTINQIKVDEPADQDYLKEQDYLAALEREEKGRGDRAGDMPSTEMVRCGNCNAETTLSRDRTSDNCPYCGSPLAMQNHFSAKLNVQAVLPFVVSNDKAIQTYRDWVKSRWFAPNDFKYRATRQESMKGVYMPYWTYDSATQTWYTGQRGDAYYTTEMVPVRQQNGQMTMQPRQVRRIRWSPVSGNVRVAFDDVLVPASHSLPETLADTLEPWELKNLKPFKQEFLSGFVTETYKLGLKDGFQNAQTRMGPIIDGAVARAIGGDEQRVTSKKSQYSNITFKHILLPVWISAYAYGGASYRFVVNAQTGQASGDRPWSVFKIAAAVIAGLLLVGWLVYTMMKMDGDIGGVVPGGGYQQQTYQQSPFGQQSSPYGGQSVGQPSPFGGRQRGYQEEGTPFGGTQQTSPQYYPPPPSEDSY